MTLLATHLNPQGGRYLGESYWPGVALAELFHATVARHPEHVTLIEASQRLTLAQLASVVDRLANGLMQLGFGRGDVIAYQLPNWWEAAAIFLATSQIGATANPLLPTFRATELRFTLQQSGATVIFVPGVWRGCDHRQLVNELRGELPSLREVFVVRDEPVAAARQFGDLLGGATIGGLQRVDPDSITLLMYTSGTTAAPKGVLHTHNTLAAEVMSLQRVHQLTPDDRTLMPSPLTHISGVIHGILAPALLGTSAVLMDRWDAAVGMQLLQRERVTYMVGAPTFLQELLAQPQVAEEDTTSFRLFSCGGASVTPALIEAARRRFPSCVAKRVYGSTEFPTITTTDAGDALSRGIDTEGRAITPGEVRIVDGLGTTLGTNDHAEGEVQARGPECFVGYLDARLNDEAFTSDGWFRSGDLGRLDADGYLRISGRLKDIIIRKGEKISAAEVEEAIATHPDVLEVSVIALPDTTRGECVCAVVRLQEGASLDLPGLTSFLAARGLAKAKWPELLRLIDQLPRTDSGKVRKDVLRQRIAQVDGP